MPIDYTQYHPKWHLIIRLVRKRDGNCCKWCGVANGAVGKRSKGQFRLLTPSECEMLRYPGWRTDAGHIKALGFTKIILTVAHLDHNKNNNHFSNLAALCQRCHLGHDIQQHTANRKYGRNHNAAHQLRLL